MKKIRRIAAIAAALCLSATAFTGCGGDSSSSSASKSSSAQKSSADSEGNAESSAQEEIDEEPETEEATEAEEASEDDALPAIEPGDVVYEPSDEIKNASFGSGYIQIGMDVFRAGGYITVEEFVKKYGNRYDFSKVDLDKSSKSTGSFEVKALYDPDLKFYVLYDGRYAESDRLGDMAITHFNPDDHKSTDDKLWLPKGVAPADCVNIYDYIKEIEAAGITEGEAEWGSDISSMSNAGNHYYWLTKSEYSSSMIFNVLADEPNLGGEKMVLVYTLKTDPNQNINACYLEAK